MYKLQALLRQGVDSMNKVTNYNRCELITQLNGQIGVPGHVQDTHWMTTNIT